MTPTPELNKAMVAALAEMPPVPLDSKNPFLKNRYASLGSVIGVSKPVLAKHGLAMEQQPFDRDGRIGVRTIVRHISGECSQSEIAIEATNEKGLSGAQVAGSIFTYLRRYAWSAVCGLYADEDTDGNAPESSKTATRSVPEPPTTQSSPKEEKPLKSTYSPKETEAEKKARLVRLEAWLVKCRTKLLMEAGETERMLTDYCIKAGLCLPSEGYPDVELGKLFPSVNWDLDVKSNEVAVAQDAAKFFAAVKVFADGGEVRPDGPVPDPESTADENPWFLDIIVPVPRKGMLKKDYDRAPDTIRSLYEQRHGTDEESQIARERLFGFVNSYKPKGWVKRDGTQMPPSAGDLKFKEALDAFGVWIGARGEKL